VKQPLAALAAAAGLALAPGRSAAAIAAAAAANKHVGPVPGSEVLQAVKQYTGSTKEVQGKVKAALQQVRACLYCPRCDC
jgi:Skp family chaperone for outer membrane proteins